VQIQRQGLWWWCHGNGGGVSFYVNAIDDVTVARACVFTRRWRRRSHWSDAACRHRKPRSNARWPTCHPHNSYDPPFSRDFLLFSLSPYAIAAHIRARSRNTSTKYMCLYVCINNECKRNSMIREKNCIWQCTNQLVDDKSSLSVAT
jgi:hypothetical protein